MALLERVAGMAALDALVEHALRGEGGALLIEGAAGIGKTALVHYGLDAAQRAGVSALRARATQLESGFAFGVTLKLLEPAVRALDPTARDEIFRGAAAPAAFVAGGDPPPGDDVAFAMLHALYWLTVALSEREPLLLAVDDAQWADAASLRLLVHLADRLEGLPIALLVAARTAEPWPPLLDALRATCGEAVLKPPLLTGAASGALVSALAGRDATPGFAAAAHGATAGNPLFLHELVRATRELRLDLDDDAAPRVPELVGGRLAEHVRRRVDAAGEPARRVAEVLTILGEHTSLDLVAELAAVGPEAAAGAIGALAKREILAGEDPPVFVHPVIRAAVAESLNLAATDRLHRAAARLLAAREAPADAVASHLLRCRPEGDPQTVEWLLAAAREANARGAPESAFALLERALAEPPQPTARPHVLRGIARIEESEWRDDGGISRYREAIAAAEPNERAEIAFSLAHTLAQRGLFVDAVDALASARDETPADGGVGDRLNAEIAGYGMVHPLTRPAALASLHAVGADRDGRTAQAADFAQGLATFIDGGPADACAAQFERGLALGGPRSTGISAWLHTMASITLTFSERPEASQRHVNAALAEYSAAGVAPGALELGSFDVSLALADLALGKLPDAITRMRRVVQLRGWMGTPSAAFDAAVLAEALVEAGDIDDAEAVLDALPDVCWGLENPGSDWITGVRADIATRRHRIEDARTGLEFLAAYYGAIEACGAATRGYRNQLATVLALSGARDASRRVLAEELEQARTWQGSRALGTALRTAGLLATGDAAIARLRESAELLSGSSATLERAKTLAVLGAALRRDGQRAASREPLSEALDLAYRCGARGLIEHASVELRAAGARPRRVMRRGVEALTPSELRVAQLAADGATNREIAQELYITLKTVEGHIANTYLKLGLSGRGARTELASVLAGEDP